VCTHPKGKEVKEAYYSGKLNLAEASAELGLPQSTVWHCLQYHREEAVTTVSEQSWTELLESLLSKLKERLDVLLHTPVEEGNERVIVLLIREIRGLISDLSRLKGIVTSSSVIIQQYNLTINKFQSWLVSNLCSGCRQKFLKYLEEAR